MLGSDAVDDYIPLAYDLCSPSSFILQCSLSKDATLISLFGSMHDVLRVHWLFISNQDIPRVTGV